MAGRLGWRIATPIEEGRDGEARGREAKGHAANGGEARGREVNSHRVNGRKANASARPPSSDATLASPPSVPGSSTSVQELTRRRGTAEGDAAQVGSPSARHRAGSSGDVVAYNRGGRGLKLQDGHRDASPALLHRAGSFSAVVAYNRSLGSRDNEIREGICHDDIDRDCSSRGARSGSLCSRDDERSEGNSPAEPQPPAAPLTLKTLGRALALRDAVGRWARVVLVQSAPNLCEGTFQPHTGTNHGRCLNQHGRSRSIA
jgi:hypothetical protein